MLGKELVDRLLIAQIEFLVCPGEDIPIPFTGKLPAQSGAHQAPVAGYINGIGWLHGHVPAERVNWTKNDMKHMVVQCSFFC
jgi:hypothetical protein